jgi:hypothetical protein
MSSTTEPPDDSLPPSVPRRRRRGLRWLVAAAAVLALAAAVRLALPYAVGYGVERWLTAAGAREVAVRDVTLGLWSVRVALADVRARGDRGEGFAFSRVEASIDLPALFDRHVLLNELALDGVDVMAVRDGRGVWRIGGFSRGTAEGTPEGEAGAGGWSFGVRALELRRARIRWQGWGIADTLAVERLRLANVIAWDPAGPLTLEADLGLRTGSLAARGSLRPFGAGRTARIEIDAAALPLAVAAPALRELGVERLAGSARLRATLTAAEREGGLHIGLTGEAALDDASARAGGAGIGISGLRWQGSATVAVGPALNAAIDGTLSLARLDLRSGSTVLAAKDVGWTAAWRVGPAAGARALEATGTGTATGGALSLTDGAAAALRYDTLRWEGRTGLRIDPGRTVYADADGTLALGRLRGEGGGLALAGDSVAWRGRVSASRAGPQNEAALLLHGAVSAAGLALRDSVRGLDGEAASAEWEGSGEFESWDGAPELFGSVVGRVALRGVRLDDSVRGIGLGAAERVAASGLFASLRGDVLVRDLELDQPRLLGRAGGDGTTAPVVAARVLYADGVGVTTGGIEVGEVGLDDARVTLVRDRGGRFAGIAPLPGAGEGGGGAADGEAPAIAAVGPVRIGGKSRLTFEDRSLDPPFRAVAEPFSLTVGPVQAGAPAADTAVAFDATLRPHTRVTLAGTVRPLAARLTLDLRGKIDALDLAPLSRYAESHLGYALKTGQLDGEASLRVNRGRLSGSGTLDVRRLDVVLFDGARSKPLRDALPVSLETALALLRDDANRIRVTVPVGGDMDDPTFDPGDAVNQAIGSAIADTMTTTLKVLFPVGALAAAVIGEATADRALRFSPLGFAPGAAILGGDATTYLDQLARLLAERPGVRVSLCGAATEADRRTLAADERERLRESARKDGAATAALPPVTIGPVTIGDDALMRLAGERSAAALRYLVRQKGIASKRLPRCRPSIDRADGARPRLDVIL